MGYVKKKEGNALKKSTFGMMLFLAGSIGFLVLSVFLALNPFDIENIGETTQHYTGTLGALIGNHLMLPYLIFCGFGLAGLWICISETYLRERTDKKRRPEPSEEDNSPKS